MRAPSKPVFAVRTGDSVDTSLEITVLHTNARSTVKAIEKVARLTGGLSPDIRLLVLQVVPYPLPIETPDVPLEFTAQSLVEMISHVDVDVHVDIRVGRDKSLMLESAFLTSSLIVVGSRRRWWPTPENRIAKLLRRLGHQVISTDSE